MLSKEQLHEQISDPNLCSAANLTDLSSLQLAYPYSTTFSILYLKTLANEQDVHLAKALEQYAFGIQNRALLYELLSQPTAQKQIVSSKIELQEETQVKLEEEIYEERQEELEEEIQEEHQEELKEARQEERKDELDHIMRSSLIATSFVELTYTEELAALEQQLPTSTEEIADANEGAQIEAQQDTTKLTQVEKSAYTFSEWLHFKEDVDEQTAPRQYLTFEKPKQELYSPAKKAKESLSSEQIPVSETLAKVYAMQGAVTKAIGVYEQLILLNPEKKSFFANQIKTLKKNLNASS